MHQALKNVKKDVTNKATLFFLLEMTHHVFIDSIRDGTTKIVIS